MKYKKSTKNNNKYNYSLIRIAIPYWDKEQLNKYKKMNLE